MQKKMLPIQTTRISMGGRKGAGSLAEILKMEKIPAGFATKYKRTVGVSRPLSALTEHDYDFLFKIVINQDAYATLSTQHYGMRHHISIIKN